MNRIVEVKGLEKCYGNKKAVCDIDFYVNEGEVLGFLGPNGAGKSTTINILSTILKPDKGNVQMVGEDLTKNVKAIKQKIGIVPQDIAIYEEISAEKNVEFFASLYGLKGGELKQKVKEALEFVELFDRKDDKPKTFSGGMKRRLNIACAIAHQPKLIIMDEPTVGIDPQSRNHILESIISLKKKGTTVIYTTHYMEEIETIADRIIILNEGKIIAEGNMDELNKLIADEAIYVFEVDDIKKVSIGKINTVKGISKVEFEENAVKVKLSNKEGNLNDLVGMMLASGCLIHNMKRIEASLETVFLELTGKNLRD